MPDDAQYLGLNVRKYAREPKDHAELVFHATTGTRPLGGVRFTERHSPRTSDLAGKPVGPPPHIRVPMDYAQRESWIQLVNPQAVVKPGGPADDPYRLTHTFLHADALVLHTETGDFRYRVVRQPDKYSGVIEDGGEPTDATGDPRAEVRWFYDADLEGDTDG